MKRIQKFYKCNECGNIIGVINNTGIPLHCCNMEMEELIPNQVDFSKTNHITSQILNTPEHIKNSNNYFKIFKVKKDENDNSISLIIDKNYLTKDSLCWAYLKTEKGGQRKNLANTDVPVLDFRIINDKPLSAYFYCSNHGLFKVDF